MARVIQQQKSGPPYLLIMFVFLFLAATTVSVLLYLQGDKDKAERDKALDMKRALAGTELETGTVQPMLDVYRRDGVSVVKQLDQKIERLTEFITGHAKSTNAEALAEEAYNDAKRSLPGIGRVGLAVAVQKACEKVDTLNEQVRKDAAHVVSLNASLAGKDKEIGDLGKAREKDREELSKKIAELDETLKKERADRQKEVADLSTDREKQIQTRNEQIAAKTITIDNQERTIKILMDKIAEYERKIVKTDFVDPTRPQERKANGTVQRVGGTQTVYIDLGGRDRVKPGLPFSVYPPTGVPEDPNNYVAKIVVTDVDPTFSTCRVTAQNSRERPVMVNDIVFNVAFDRVRTFKFVVVGWFDVYNTRGRPDILGAEEVKLLIERFGGVVQPEVTSDTDYVVAGAEPAVPRAPADAAGGSIPPELEKARAAYLAAKAAADKSRIPVLNTNRFLAMTGFEPSITTGGR